jgi:hypothetical protein
VLDFVWLLLWESWFTVNLLLACFGKATCKWPCSCTVFVSPLRLESHWALWMRDHWLLCIGLALYLVPPHQAHDWNHLWKSGVFVNLGCEKYMKLVSSPRLGCHGQRLSFPWYLIAWSWVWETVELSWSVIAGMAALGAVNPFWSLVSMGQSAPITLLFLMPVLPSSSDSSVLLSWEAWPGEVGFPGCAVHSLHSSVHWMSNSWFLSKETQGGPGIDQLCMTYYDEVNTLNLLILQKQEGHN